ncbi:MAG: hypothetical protein AB8B61_04760 [Cyclobacteriaceae bacterium]
MFSKLLYVCLSCLLFSQFTQAATQDSCLFSIQNDEKYWIEPIDTNGLIYVRLQGNTRQSLELITYDTSFTELKKINYAIPKKYYFRLKKQYNSFYYVLASDKVNKKYILITVDIKKLTFTETYFTTYINSSPTKLHVLGDYAYIAGMLKNKPTITQVSISKKRAKVIPFPMQGHGMVQSMVSNKKMELLDILLYSSHKKENFAELLSFDMNGKQKNRRKVKLTKENHLQSASLDRKSRDIINVLGTYSNDLKGSHGIYHITYAKESTIKLYPISLFTHYYDFLPEKAQTQIKQQIIKRKEKNKPVSFSDHLLIHPLVRFDDYNLLIAEAYQPTYRQEPFITYIFGRQTIQYRTVFDGWQKSHFIHATIRNDGEMVENGSIKLTNSKSFTLSKAVLSQDNSIFYKTPDGLTKLIIDKKTGRLSNEEKIIPHKKNNSNSNYRYWYSNTLLESSISKERWSLMRSFARETITLKKIKLP